MMTKQEVALWQILMDMKYRERDSMELSRKNRGEVSSAFFEAGYKCFADGKPLPEDSDQAFIDGYNASRLDEEEKALKKQAEAMIKYVGDSSYYIIHAGASMIVYKKYTEFRKILAECMATQELIGEILSYAGEGHHLGPVGNIIDNDSSRLANQVRIFTDMLLGGKSEVNRAAKKLAKKLVSEFKEYISSGVKKEQTRWLKIAKQRAHTVARRIVDIELEAAKCRYLCDAFWVDRGISAERYWQGNVTSPEDDRDSVLVPKGIYRIGKHEAANIVTFLDTIPWTRNEIDTHYIRKYSEYIEYEDISVIGYSYDSFKRFLAIRSITAKRLIKILNAELKKAREKKGLKASK